jgi:hypothetical protein
MMYIDILMRWFLRMSAVQLFLTLISLPILVGWGLSVSYLTPVGTLFFTPLLTVYLWSALMVFFTTLFCIPNELCIKLLSYVSNWWLWLLSLIKMPHAIGFVCPPLPFLCLIPITGFVVVMYCRTKKLWFMVVALAILLSMWVALLGYFGPEPYIEVVHANNKKIEAFYCHNQVTVIDTDSSCSSILDGTSWIVHTVMPIITKKTGAISIDRFVVLHPRQRSFEALTALCKKGIIKDVYVPYWQGHIPRGAFFAYMQLKNTLIEYGCRIYILKTSELFMIDENHVLKVTDTHQKYGDAMYPLFAVHNNNNKELYG